MLTSNSNLWIFNIEILIVVLILDRKIIKYIYIVRLRAGIHPDRPVVQRPDGAAMILQDLVKVEVEKLT